MMKIKIFNIFFMFAIVLLNINLYAQKSRIQNPESRIQK